MGLYMGHPDSDQRSKHTDVGSRGTGIYFCDARCIKVSKPAIKWDKGWVGEQ